MRDGRPTISIVITCFNYARYVGQAINSALAQTYRDVEIIVVDDGSSDGSAEIIDAYHGRVTVVRQANKGSIPAYNNGFAASSGDVVIFLDADDCVSPELGARVAERWTPGCCKVQYDLTIIDEHGLDLGRRFCNFTSRYSSDDVKGEFARFGTYRWPVTTGNGYSRWFLELFMPLTISHGPDGFFNTIAPIYGDVITIQDPLASYRLHGQNLWAAVGVKWAERIDKRLLEIANLEEHAARLNVALPTGNLLDHDLVFINYRLMALKLGEPYRGSEQDRPSKLWLAGMRTCWVIAMPRRIKLVHVTWLSALTLAPTWLASHIINLRFNRAKLFKIARRQTGPAYLIQNSYEEA